MASTLVWLTASAGCTGGESADLSGRRYGPCEDHIVILDRNETSSLGFSAASVLAFATQPFTAPLTWQPTEGVTYAPGPGQSTVTVTVSSPGQAQLVHSTNSVITSTEPMPDVVSVCLPDNMRIAVHVEVATADGAVDEAIDGELLTFDGRVASLGAALDLTALGGSFAVRPNNASAMWNTAAIQGVGLGAMVTGAGVAGDLNVQVLSNEPLRRAQTVTFARFPDDPACPSDELRSRQLPVPIDSAVLGTSGSDAMKVINASGPLALRWASGPATELTLRLSDLRSGCLAHGYWLPDAPAARITYPVTLAAKTADGRLEGSYPASLVTWLTPSGLQFTKRIALNTPFEVQDIDRVGFRDVTAPSGAHQLGLNIDATFDDSGASGVVELNATADPPCATMPQRIPAECFGTIVTPIVAGRWGSR